MLLSRVAESVYWAGRYLERAESTARLIKVHTELFLDLPKSVDVGWVPLLAVTGSGGVFQERFGADPSQATEEEVVRFLASDPTSPASVLSSLSSARENFRTTRAVIPTSSWTELNGLFLWVSEMRSLATDRRTRLAWMEHVIRSCHVLRGVLESTMSHDAAYAFLQIGRSLECADMTTRVLDVQASVLVKAHDSYTSVNDSSVSEQSTYSDITWMSVLKSLSAHQMYRRTVRKGVSGPDALHFLLCDTHFPRSVDHSLVRISRALIELPRFDASMARCAEVQELIVSAEVAEMTASDLHEYVDQLQLGIARIHDSVTDSYFVRVPTNARSNEQVMLTSAS